MDYGSKKIKLEIEALQEEETDEVDVMCSFDQESAESGDECIKLEPGNLVVKEEIEEDQVGFAGNMEEVGANLHEIDEGRLSLHTEDEPENEFTVYKLDNRTRPFNAVRDFICTTCDYATKKLIDYTDHWLSHEEQSYTNENGVYVCQMFDCFYMALNKKDLLKHIASQHLYRYRCQFCYYVTYSKKDYDEHRSAHYTYQCVKCDLQSTKLFFVQDHLETPLICNICDFTSYHWFLHKKHINWHHYPPDSIVKCEFCDFTTGNQDLLESHKILHRAKFVLCKMCRFQGKNKADLAKHCKNIHDTTLEAVDKLYKCKFCMCKFIGQGSKEKHEELHLKNGVSLKCCSKSITLQCPYCDHQENQREDMHLHVQSKHTSELELDGFRFQNSSDETLVKDLVLNDLAACDDKINAENGEENENEIVITDNIGEDQGIEDLYENCVQKKNSWCCPICFRYSKDKLDLNRHLLTLHNMSYTTAKKLTNSFCCAFCSFATTDKDLFDSHSTAHSTSKNVKVKRTQKLTLNAIKSTEKLGTQKTQYTCYFCYYETTSKEDYDIHCKTHFIYKCAKCSFESTKQLFVEDHIDNPWICPKCKFQTHHWLLMKSHSSSHKIQTFTLLKCKKCNFETRRPGDLKMHSLSHTTLLLRCKICMFKTRCENSLQNHYAKLHNGILPNDEAILSDERPYECDLCACKFKQQVYLDKHRALHGENGPFRIKCSQCHESKKKDKYDNVVKKVTRQDGDKPDSWRACPYCTYEDEARYRMIEHLSQIHPKQLEIEGYMLERHKATSIDDHAQEASNTAVPQLKGILHTVNAKTITKDEENHEKSTSTEQNQEETEINTEEDTRNGGDSPECISSPNQQHNCSLRSRPARNLSSKQRAMYIPKHLNKEHGLGMFKCKICGYAAKGMHFIDHMDKKHPPLTAHQAFANNVSKQKMFFCVVCAYAAKKKYFICKHMLTKHAFEESGENDLSLNHPNILDPEQSKSTADAGTIITKQEHTECEVDAYLKNSLEEKDTSSMYKPIEQVEIKVEPTDFAGQDFLEYITPEDQEQTDIKQNQGLTSEIVPIYCEQGKNWCCPLCTYIVSRKRFVEQHLLRRHKGAEKKTWYCWSCPYQTKLGEKLQQHVALMHRAEHRPNITTEEIPCKQPGCEFKAPTVDELSTHMARHLQSSMQEVMVYKCDRCSFGTVSKTIFRNHSNLCQHVKWYQCYDCNFKSESKKGIWFHINRMHRYNTCRKCGYSAKGKSWMRTHHIHCEIKGKLKS